MKKNMVIVLALLALGCSKKESKDGVSSRISPASAQVKFVMLPNQSVKLVDPGKAPQERYQFTLTPGLKERMIMDFDVKMLSGAQSMLLLSVVWTSDIVHKKMTKDGGLSYIFTDSMRAKPGMTNFKKFNELVNKQTIETLKTYAPTGIEGEKVLLSKNLNPVVQKMATQIQSSNSVPTLVFPKEKIGVGAKWVYRAEMENSGKTFPAVYLFSLNKVEGDKAYISIQYDIAVKDLKVKGYNASFRLTGKNNCVYTKNRFAISGDVTGTVKVLIQGSENIVTYNATLKAM
ncbi:hypothetical protein KKF84_06170 [Myxococcota bacterium]|nr:hypothetical protein [Myxococcota bacterium]MBU1534885.1 hypothetical protein [Myxococcota bacterium]